MPPLVNLCRNVFYQNGGGLVRLYADMKICETYRTLSSYTCLVHIQFHTLSLSVFLQKKDIKPKHTKLIEIPLSELSTMWTGKHIIKGEQTESKHTNVIFNKEELTAFYSKHVEQLPESARGVIEQILKMLDERCNNLFPDLRRSP